MSSRAMQYAGHGLDALSGEAWQQLLLTLAHSLWQGALVAALLGLALTRIPAARPNARYLTALSALGAVLVLCCLTWSVLDVRATTTAVGKAASATSIHHEPNREPDQLTGAIHLRKQPIDAPAVENDVLLSHDQRKHWAAACTVAWLTGVAVMLARMAWLVTGAKRLACGRPMLDERVLQMLDDLRDRLHIRRSITVVDAGTVGPAVYGILRPVLLLPAAMLSGLPNDCVEAILAHELAHIRRNDYLVNLLQMCVEAILFFNPAVWWISRQVRREREASCDAMAIAATGEATGYVQALATWIESSRATSLAPATAALAPTTAALAMHGGGSTLERIRRIVLAGYRPELKASWQVFVGGLFFSALALAILWRGAQTGVALAADILSPTERLEQLSQERDKLRPLVPEDPDNSKITISGTILMPDGKPFMGDAHIHFMSRVERSGYGASEFFKGPKFSHQVNTGTLRLLVTTPGYAPTSAGPWQTKPGEAIEGLEIKLDPGFASGLRVINEQGQPIQGASATASFNEFGLASWKSNASGILEIEHASKGAYSFTITAPGYQATRLEDITLRPAEVTTATLKRARPTTGIVVSPNGKPIGGATLRCAAQVGFQNNTANGENGQILATTDAEGRFSLDSLDDGGSYWLLVETADHGRRMFPDIKSGQADLRLEVGPDLTVTGKIVGDLSELTQYDGKPVVRTSQPISIRRPGSSYEFSIPGRTNVDGEGRFTLRNLLPGQLSISAGKQHLTLEVTKPSEEVTIDLNQPLLKPDMRRVVLRFVGADKGLSPSGQVSITSVDVNQVGSQISKDLSIKDNRVEFDAYAHGHVSFSARNVVGYWFKDEVFLVQPGEGAVEREIKVLPAGAVRGRVLNADGSSVTERVNVGARGDLAISPGRTTIVTIENVRVNSEGEVFVSPLPFGTTYVLRASRGFEQAISDPIWIDEEHVSPTVELKFSPTKSATVEVIGPDDKPRAGVPVQLEFSHPKASTSYGPPSQTDAQGRCTFEGLSTGVGEYYARVAFEDPTLRPAPVRLNLGGEPVQIELLDGEAK